jgi:hypothetical protein
MQVEGVKLQMRQFYTKLCDKPNADEPQSAYRNLPFILGLTLAALPSFKLIKDLILDYLISFKHQQWKQSKFQYSR